VGRVRKALREAGDAAAADKGRRFFKEEVRLLGVSVPATKRIAAEYFESIKDEPKETLFSLCEELWRSDMMEETWVICEWAYAKRDAYTPGDFAVFASWLEKYVDNWGTCDTLCNHSIGHLLESFPEQAAKTSAWTRSPCRWLRRGAAVSYIIPARKGLFADTIFRTADALIGDGDDLVRKGYGWALKACSEAFPDRVYDFVVARHAVMPRTAYRYALEKMPADLRKKAMALPGPKKRGNG
jgi:Predicted DNA alkylation repair enzyme